MNDAPSAPTRKHSELTVPIDRSAISAAAKKAIADAIETYPDESVRDDAVAQEAIRDRPTLVRCPAKCTPCGCCGGAGMVTLEQAAAWGENHDGADAVLFDIDEPGE